MKAPLFPMEASEKGASGSQISPGKTKKNWKNLFSIGQLFWFKREQHFHIINEICVCSLFSTRHILLRNLFHILLRPTLGKQVVFFLLNL